MIYAIWFPYFLFFGNIYIIIIAAICYVLAKFTFGPSNVDAAIKYLTFDLLSKLSALFLLSMISYELHLINKKFFVSCKYTDP